MLPCWNPPFAAIHKHPHKVIPTQISIMKDDIIPQLPVSGYGVVGRNAIFIEVWGYLQYHKTLKGVVAIYPNKNLKIYQFTIELN